MYFLQMKSTNCYYCFSSVQTDDSRQIRFEFVPCLDRTHKNSRLRVSSCSTTTRTRLIWLQPRRSNSNWLRTGQARRSTGLRVWKKHTQTMIRLKFTGTDRIRFSQLHRALTSGAYWTERKKKCQHLIIMNSGYIFQCAIIIRLSFGPTPIIPN